MVVEKDRPSPILLEDDLGGLGFDLSDLDPVAIELDHFAHAIDAERRGTAGGPYIPLVRVALVTMDALAKVSDVDAETLQLLARQLVDDEHLAVDPEAPSRVARALVTAAGIPTDRIAERWTTLRETSRRRPDGAIPLRQEVTAVKLATCDDSIVPFGTEEATRIQTQFEVDHGPNAFDGLANACLPENWAACNDFFCSLVPCPDRDIDCGITTSATPQAAASDWSAVFQERVLRCPDGAFPDTFLLMTWTRGTDELILQYRLVPRRRPGDRTVLAIDQGFIQVERLSTTYRVTTQKNLLFDDDRLPSGGRRSPRTPAGSAGWTTRSPNSLTAPGTFLLPWPVRHRAMGRRPIPRSSWTRSSIAARDISGTGRPSAPPTSMTAWPGSVPERSPSTITWPSALAGWPRPRRSTALPGSRASSICSWQRADSPTSSPTTGGGPVAPPDPPPPTTPVGEAIEQATDGLSMWCRDIAELVQTDVDRMASGGYHLADFGTAGIRLLRIGVDNAIRMAGVFSDNLALLTATRADPRAATTRETKKTVPVPPSVPVTINSSSLIGHATRRPIPKSSITVSPSTHAPDGTAELDVTITIATKGPRTDVYEGKLFVVANGRTLKTVPYKVAIDELA